MSCAGVIPAPATTRRPVNRQIKPLNGSVTTLQGPQVWGTAGQRCALDASPCRSMAQQKLRRCELRCTASLWQPAFPSLRGRGTITTVRRPGSCRYRNKQKSRSPWTQVPHRGPEACCSFGQHTQLSPNTGLTAPWNGQNSGKSHRTVATIAGGSFQTSLRASAGEAAQPGFADAFRNVMQQVQASLQGVMQAPPSTAAALRVEGLTHQPAGRLSSYQLLTCQDDVFDRLGNESVIYADVAFLLCHLTSASCLSYHLILLSDTAPTSDQLTPRQSTSL